jgi:hypothetical protein
MADVRISRPEEIIFVVLQAPFLNQMLLLALWIILVISLNKAEFQMCFLKSD